jgi:DNA-3-methyladenine glycosylase
VKKSIPLPTKRKILPESFFAQPTPRVAQALLGKFLVRKWRGKEYAHMITEVEVYDGHSDRASHAYRGKTPRSRLMFGAPGVWYVYLIYGMYEM